MSQLIPIDTLDGFSDQLCDTCQSVFDHEAIQVLLEQPDDVSCKRQHLLCTEILASQINCHLCAWIVSQSHRSVITASFGDGTGMLRKDFGSVAVAGADEGERIFVELRKTAFEVVGLQISSVAALAGSVLLSPVGPIKVRNLLSRRTTPSKCINLNTIHTIQSWLGDCVAEHKFCGNEWKLFSSSASPSRLLEVGEMGDSVRVRSTSRLSPGYSYLTLSHCWGQSVQCKLLESNLESYEESVPIDQLTRTFKEAVDLTWRLGFRYIWIDALCIIQDSDEDWLNESAKMGDIYTHGVLNIAATASADGTGGLFHSPPALSPCIVRVQDEKSQQFSFITHGEDDYPKRIDGEHAPLNSRGWVLQEQLLSPRTIHFTYDEVLWECYEYRSAEVLPDTIYHGRRISHKPLILDTLKEKPGSYKTWHSLMGFYSKCCLTFHNDKLAAISGIASRFAYQRGIQSSSYLAGLWKENLVDDLLWSPLYGESKSYPDRAPSWSWARVDAQIYFHGVQGQCRISIVTAQAESSGDPFGRAPRGSIVLQGPMCKVKLTTPKRQPTFPELRRNYDGNVKDDTVEIPAWGVQWDDWSDEDCHNDGLSFLLICDTDYSVQNVSAFTAILIRLTGNTRGQYERIGLVNVQGISPEQISAITIVAGSIPENLHLGSDTEKGCMIELI